MSNTSDPESPIANAVADAVARLAEALSISGRRLAVAESCTGGLLAARLTDRPGSSEWFERGWVTYSNRAKVEALGVAPNLLEQQGAVSQACVRAMAAAALKQAGTDYAVSISGVAGPDGGSERKPVGTVWFGFAHRNNDADDVTLFSARFLFPGSRSAVRDAAVYTAIAGLLAHINTNNWQADDPEHWHEGFWPCAELKSGGCDDGR